MCPGSAGKQQLLRTESKQMKRFVDPLWTANHKKALSNHRKKEKTAGLWESGNILHEKCCIGISTPILDIFVL